MEKNEPKVAAPQSDLDPDSERRNKHLSAIQAVAEEVGRPVGEIAQAYEEMLQGMASTATVPDFLPVLISKKVRERFRRAH